MKPLIMIASTLCVSSFTLTKNVLALPELAPQRQLFLVEDHGAEHQHVFHPQEEQDYLQWLADKDLSDSAFRFPQSKWDECTFDPSGNYSGIACARARQISVILQKYLAEFIYECVDVGLARMGGGKASDVHLVHDGILGDPRHSPRSMHAEARAIDIKAITVKFRQGGAKSFVFDNSSQRPFFEAFRECWGKVIHRENSCPYFEGRVDRTGTIGWEDGDHQHHMHTSVPYCVQNQYDSYYFRR